jgi:MFS family permease
MRSWLLRGLIFAFGMVVLRLVQGAMINTWETQAQVISIFLVLIFALAALVWGYFDGRSDAQAQPDPDRRGDLAMTWLLAGLVAGILSGAVAWLISLFYKTMYVAGLMNEITTFAAFTALVVFVMATLGVAAGRVLVDRRYDKEHPVPQHDGSHGPDTDVFAAVGGGRTAARAAEDQRYDEGRTEEMPLYEGRTQEAPLHEGRTQEAQTPPERNQ